MEDLKQKTIRGGIARLCGQALDFVLRIASLIILARLLDPKDFGLVSMVTVVTSFYGLSLSGLAAPIIQSSSITDEQLSTLFWINMLIGTVLALLCVLTAPVLASFYGDQRLFWVTATIAVGFVFSAAEMQHSALLQRQLRFVALSLIEALRLTASTTIAVGMALAGFGYWALVASLVLSPLIGAVCLWTITRWIPNSRAAYIRSVLCCTLAAQSV